MASARGRPSHPGGAFRPASGAATSRVRLPGAVPLAEVTAVGVSRTDDIAVKLNTRPRKTLDYDTPADRLAALLQ